MNCPTCGTVIPVGILAAKCSSCGFDSSRALSLPDLDLQDLGHGIVLRWDADGGGFAWKHPECRAWSTLRFRPDPKSTGHQLLAGGEHDRDALTIGGSLLCPGGCGKHGHIRNGRWIPD